MAGFNKLGDEIKKSLSGIFAKEASTAASSAKSPKITGSDKAGGKREVPNEPHEALWLQTALNETFSLFGKHVSENLVTIEKDLNDKLDTSIARQDEKLGKIDSLEIQVKQMQATISEMQTENASFATKIDTASTAASAAIASQSSSTPQFAHASTPYEMRTVARIGNLGWDTDEKILMERALELLGKANITQDMYTGLSASIGRSGTGSAAELCFYQSQKLQTARMAIKALRCEFSAGRVAWLDAKKERAEMKPARVVHRLADFLQDIENTREEKFEVEKVMNGKFVKINGQRVGFTLRGEWQWTAWACSRYSVETMEMAKAYAEGD
jgi:hypothetical protein